MRIYTPTTTAKAEQEIGWRFRQAYPGLAPDKVMRYAVRLTFHCRREGRGDVDNRTKTVLDALNKIVWDDDRQIDELHALIVHRATNPRTEIEIYRKRPEWR
jgi:Holliday junction resolvase RusA-like endonuclease